MKTLNNPIIRDLLQKALTAKSHEEMVSYLLNLLALVERNIYCSPIKWDIIKV